MTDLAELRTLVTSPVLLPTDDGFAEEATGQNLRHVHHPQVIVAATSAEDVAAVVSFARGHALAVRVLATGHGIYAPVTDGVLLTTRHLTGVTIDADTRTARVAAGEQWAAVVAAAAPHGLAPIAGSSASVGVVGYLLGGGFGPLVRSHGVSSDHVRSLTVVTGTGEIVTASDSQESDLFWALRGGKGGLGIVTEVEIALAAIDTLYAGSLTILNEGVEPALRAWLDFTLTAPDDVSTSVSLSHYPDLEFLPEPLRGQDVLALRFAYPGEAEEGARVAAPLRAAAPALVDTIDVLPLADVATIHSDPTDPAPSWTTAITFGPIDQDFASALLAAAGPRAGTPFVAAELRHLGGAVRASGEGAVGGREAEYILTLVAITPVPEAVTAAETAALAIADALRPWALATNSINFYPAHLPHAERYTSSWPEETRARLAAVRGAVDPDGVFPYGA